MCVFSIVDCLCRIGRRAARSSFWDSGSRGVDEARILLGPLQKGSTACISLARIPLSLSRGACIVEAVVRRTPNFVPPLFFSLLPANTVGKNETKMHHRLFSATADTMYAVGRAHGDSQAGNGSAYICQSHIRSTVSALCLIRGGCQSEVLHHRASPRLPVHIRLSCDAMLVAETGSVGRHDLPPSSVARTTRQPIPK